MFYYLANPYNGTDTIKQERFEKCCHAVSSLIKNGIHTFSPIVHNHSILETTKNWTLVDRQNLLLPFDFSILKNAKGMIILMLDGWEKSFGVQKEIEFCKNHNINIHHFTFDEIINIDPKLDKLKIKDKNLF